MAVIRKNIDFWQNWNNGHSEASLEALGKEVSKFTAYMEKLYAENWKHNLIGLYFPITFTAEQVMESNAISKKYRLSILDLTAAIQRAAQEDQEPLYQAYALVIFDMCSHYEHLYEKMERDRAIVKTALLGDFSALAAQK